MSTGFVFGVVNDEDDSLKSKAAGGKFGLNTGVISKLEFLSTAGKDNGPGNAVDIWFLLGEREYRRRIYETTGQLFGKKDVRLNPGEEGYDDLYRVDMTQKMAVINHALKAVGVTQEAISKVLASGATDFTDWCNKVLSLVPAGFQNKPVDAFLEYQWEIAEDQDKTYVELPKNMKGGAFLKSSVIPVGGTWTEVRNDKGLHYVDSAGNIHPFDRDIAFMESNKAIQQGVGAPVANSGAAALNNAANTADKSTW